MLIGKSLFLVASIILLQSTQANSKRPQGTANPSCPLDDDPNDPTHLPYAGDCTKFQKCSYGVAYPLNCPMGQHWSIELDRCEAISLANCNPGVTTTISPGGGSCTSRFKPDETDCQRFYQCVDGKDILMTCPPNAYWNKTDNKCIFGTCPY